MEQKLPASVNNLENKSVKDQIKFKLILEIIKKEGIMISENQWGKGAKLFAALIKLYLTEQHTLTDSPIKELLLMGNGEEGKLLGKLLVKLLSPRQLFNIMSNYIDLTLETSLTGTFFREDSNLNQTFFLLLKRLGKKYFKLVSSHVNSYCNYPEPVQWFFAIIDKLDQLPSSLQWLLATIYIKLIEKFGLEDANNTIIQIFAFNVVTSTLMELNVQANTCNIIKQLFTAKEVNVNLLSYLEKAKIDPSSIPFQLCLTKREKFFFHLNETKNLQCIYFNDIETELESERITLKVSNQLEDYAKQLLSFELNMLDDLLKQNEIQSSKNELDQQKKFSFTNFFGSSFIGTSSKNPASSPSTTEIKEQRSLSVQYESSKTERELSRKNSYPSGKFWHKTKLPGVFNKSKFLRYTDLPSVSEETKEPTEKQKEI